MQEKRIYLDFNATTPIAPEVAAAIRQALTVAAISPQTMDALTHYPWPGNIRELQNVIERSVVIYQKGNLSVKKSSFLRQPFHHSPARQSLRRSATEDRRMIDSALAEAGGRVSGPSGAAALLGIPASTLESKIRSMNINKYSFKTNSRTSSRTSQIHEPIELL